MKIETGNTILYCANWRETAAFYREVLELEQSFANDWFVEFKVARGCYLSVADAARSSIEAGGGRGLTLSLRVKDLAAAHQQIASRLAELTPIKRHAWGAEVFYLHDPAGNRIEFWSPSGAQRRS